MGAVYRAQDLRFKVEKVVAVKEMINQATDPDIQATIVETFEREANILATVSHPSIPTIYDYFTLGTRSYLVMEFIEGDNLEIKLQQRRAPFQEDEVIAWGIALCDVLDYLHNHEPEPIIFRDIKPANVMITHRNQVRLVDFGIAKTFQTEAKGTMIGTEGYSPPEQYRGEATPQVDIYALGATIHHLLTNQDPRTEPPFTFDERPIREANPGVTASMDNIISTALAYNPPERFESAGIMRKALIGLAQQTGLLEEEISVAQATQYFQDQSHSPIWTFTCEDEIRGTASYQEGVLYIGSYDHNLYALETTNGKFIWKYASNGGIVSKPAIHDNKLYFGSTDQYIHSISCRNGKKVWVQSTDGAVGTSASFMTLVGEKNLEKFHKKLSEKTGLSFFPVSTQTYPRTQDYRILSALAEVGAALNKLAFDLRVLQSPGLGEMAEPFGKNQVGSSAMPFKQNPINAEKINSLGRYLAQLPRIAWDNAANSLLERTMDDSANRRVILPQAFLTLDEMMIVCNKILTDLQIFETQISKNLDKYGPFAATEQLLMLLCKAGADRQEMHEILRKHTQVAWSEVRQGNNNPIIDLVSGDQNLLVYLSAEEISRSFTEKANVGDAVQRAKKLSAMIDKTISD